MPLEYSMHAEQGVQPGALLDVCLAGGVQGLGYHRTRNRACGHSSLRVARRCRIEWMPIHVEVGKNSRNMTLNVFIVKVHRKVARRTGPKETEEEDRYVYRREKAGQRDT